MKRPAWILFFAGLLLTGYVLVDSNRLHVREVIIRDDALAKSLGGLRLVHLSDLHFSDLSESTMLQLVDQVNALQPDLIFLTGDYVKWYASREAYAHVYRLFAGLQAKYGVFAVMGDSDYTFRRQTCAFCHDGQSGRPPTAHPVQFLRDAYVDISINGEPVRIAGLDCWQNMQPDLKQVKTLVANYTTILMSHTSLAWHELPDSSPSLVLAGDTHGGQFWLPTPIWRWTLRKPDPEHIYGLFQQGRKWLYVTSGIGTTDFNLRVGVSPEIALIVVQGGM